MNRLTEKNDNKIYTLKEMEWNPPLLVRSGCAIFDVLYRAIQKLGAYEDTGLMPDEIGKLNAETQEEARKMLERVARLSDKIEQLKHGGDPGIKFFINKDGVADVYDDTYDIVIHCESEEDQNDARLALKNVRRWIPVTERLPEPETYIFVSFDNSTTPDIATYRVDDDGSGAFYLGDEDYTYLSVGLFVNAWMPLPEPYTEEKE